jgi:hypothetical protein
MIYIVRRTQLYLDDQLWNVLHTRAQTGKTTVSELVRQAVRECYLGGREARAKAMQDFVGSRKEGPNAVDAVKYVQRLRRSTRLARLT